MFAAGLVVALSVLGADFPEEAPLIPNAEPLNDPGRYRSLRSYDETLDFYRRLFRQTGGVRWRSIVNLPSIKAKHVASMRKNSLWEGLNIYEKDGETRIYVIPREIDLDAEQLGKEETATRMKQSSRQSKQRTKARKTRKRRKKR